MKKSTVTVSLLIVLTCLAGSWSSEAYARDHLYQLSMRFAVNEPFYYPVHVAVNVYENDDAWKGVSEVDFDGSGLYNLVCDDVACITGVEVEGGSIVVRFDVDGYKSGGDFAANSMFEVVLDGVSYSTEMHTSCSRPIYIGTELPATPDGAFSIDGGDGDCLLEEGECPDDDKLYILYGNFRIPCTAPGGLTFNLYKSPDDLKATSTADDIDLSNLVCDNYVCITEATQVGDSLIVDFEAYGTKGGGNFESTSRFELVVSGCGTYHLDLHTSCSQPIYRGTPYPLTHEGVFIITDACGGCLEGGPVSTKSASWGSVKSMFR